MKYVIYDSGNSLKTAKNNVCTKMLIIYKGRKCIGALNYFLLFALFEILYFIAAVKLLLDMGSDINAQIETNRNTALTLACFQGRHEVVSLLLDRKANVEHRAKVTRTYHL